jgi:tyrosine-protein phosphatase YwqE
MFFRKQKPPQNFSLLVDFHNHLLPGWDDGSSSIEETIEMVKELASLGYNKIVFSPHVYPALFPKIEDIKSIFQHTKKELVSIFPDIDFYLAAEYMMDDTFNNVLSSSELLSFGSKYILIEFPLTHFKNHFLQYIQELLLKNYTPIIAHIERYDYFEDNDILFDFLNAGVQLQINFLSLIGYYNSKFQKRAKKLIDILPEFYLCSDLHNMNQLLFVKEFFENFKITEHIQAKILNFRLFEEL